MRALVSKRTSATSATTVLGPRRGHVAPAAAPPSHGDRTADSPHRPRGRKRRVLSVKRKVGAGLAVVRPSTPPACWRLPPSLLRRPTRGDRSAETTAVDAPYGPRGVAAGCHWSVPCARFRRAPTLLALEDFFYP